MDKQIQDLQTEVKMLYKQFNQGNYYDDLLDRFFALNNNLEIGKQTIVRLPQLKNEQKLRFKQLTHQIRYQNEILKDEDLKFLLNFLGNRDPKIRDTGVYFALMAAFRHQDITDQQVILLKDYLLRDDIIFFHLLEPENDGIFLRSFAWLVLSRLMDYDQENESQQILTAEDYREILLKATTYLIAETDGRGFVPEKGWAHVLTHMAGVFDGVQKSNLPRADKMFMFNALLFSYLNNSYSLAFGEDRVFAHSILTLMQRDSVYIDYVLDVLHYWNDFYKPIEPPRDYEGWVRFYNQMRLFDSLSSFEALPDKISNFISNELR